jgi:hypothetical protein
LVLGPVLASHPGLKLALQALCGGFLIHTARGLWMRGAASAKEVVGFRGFPNHSAYGLLRIKIPNFGEQ